VAELVIVITDLYLPCDAPELTDASGASAAAPPGLAQVLRFGTPAAPARSWRDWVVNWLGRADLGGASVASIAAAAIGARDSGPLWLATPMHWVAGLADVHLDARAILHLSATELASLAADFNAAFRHSGAVLLPLASGDLLAQGPEAFGARTVEPARARLAGLAHSLPSGGGAAVLRRLGSEIEMWLRDQALNRARAARRERTVSALWFWGGAETPPLQVPPQPLTPPTPAPLPPRPATAAPLVLGSDAYLAGLARITGAPSAPLPQELGAALPDRAAARVLLALDLASLPAAEPWSLAAALAEADRRFLAPALEALRHGALSGLTLLANDHGVQLRDRHRFRFWRRPRPGLGGLC
jgi:hypothetical protein